MNLYGDGIRTWDHSVMKQTCKPFRQHHETKWGSSSSTVVEHMPHDIEVVGSILAGRGAFLFFYLQKCVRKQVPRGGAALLFFLIINA